MIKVGVISKVLSNSRYIVYFRESYEEVEFEHSDLRIHQDWIDGKWIAAFQMLGKRKEPGEAIPEVKFSKGTVVEVSSDEDGFKGAWFAAKIIEPAGEDKYLVVYDDLRTDDDKEFLREEVDTLHIRPFPPETVMADSFNRLDQVDAWHNDGWWVGVISRVQNNSRYIVYFRESYEEALQLGQDANSPFGFNGQRCQMCLRSDPLHKVMERLANPGGETGLADLPTGVKVAWVVLDLGDGADDVLGHLWRS
ncbi:hypothetical protein EZV62_006735 [Acer yangbiense]|uniref:Agenet domain-containing protein n=1 Tax=Acer yangbiense TaxID=1000413 RepID=A0A5C7I7Z2_9ROSI|nr:hypothetical protein EZV62_006735 [Acer yangbiense]